MIFFALDQVAGAEYLLPFFLDPEVRETVEYRVFAAKPAATALVKHGLEFELVQEPDRDRVADLFRIHGPSKCVVSTTTESALERAFVRAAKEFGVPCAQLIDNWVNYAQRFSFQGEVLYPDHILTLDATARARMIREGIPADIIRVVGQPYLEYKLTQGEDAGARTKILAVSQPIDRYYGKSLGYDQWDFLNVCLDACDATGTDLALVEVNVHPAEDLQTYRHFLAERRSRAVAMKQSELRYGDYAHFLGMFSSVLLHGVLHAVPTASVQPAARGPDKCFLSEDGLIPRLTDVSAVVAYLRTGGAAAGVSHLREAVLGSGARVRTFILHEL